MPNKFKNNNDEITSNNKTQWKKQIHCSAWSIYKSKQACELEIKRNVREGIRKGIRNDHIFVINRRPTFWEKHITCDAWNIFFSFKLIWA